MHKLLNLLLPVFGLCLLYAGPLLRHRLLPLPAAASKIIQRKPSWANPSRRIILRRQYRFYLCYRDQPEKAKRAVASYNQCVADSDPAALTGTGLPRHLP